MVWHAAARAARAATAATARSSGSTGSTRRREPAYATIAADELVVLVSDGVLERTAPGGEPFGEDGLRRALEAMAAPSATAAAAAVLQAVARDHDGPLRDDASVLVLAPRLSRRGGPARGAPP